MARARAGLRQAAPRVGSQGRRARMPALRARAHPPPCEGGSSRMRWACGRGVCAAASATARQGPRGAPALRSVRCRARARPTCSRCVRARPPPPPGLRQTSGRPRWAPSLPRMPRAPRGRGPRPAARTRGGAIDLRAPWISRFELYRTRAWRCSGQSTQPVASLGNLRGLTHRRPNEAGRGPDTFEGSHCRFLLEARRVGTVRCRRGRHQEQWTARGSSRARAPAGRQPSAPDAPNSVLDSPPALPKLGPTIPCCPASSCVPPQQSDKA